MIGMVPLHLWYETYRANILKLLRYDDINYLAWSMKWKYGQVNELSIVDVEFQFMEISDLSFEMRSQTPSNQDIRFKSQKLSSTGSIFYTATLITFLINIITNGANTLLYCAWNNRFPFFRSLFRDFMSRLCCALVRCIFLNRKKSGRYWRKHSARPIHWPQDLQEGSK